MSTLQEITGYIGDVIGQTPELRALGRSQVARVPIFLAAAYELATAELFGDRFVIAFEKDGVENATPTEYHKHVRLLEEALGLKVALSLHVVPS